MRSSNDPTTILYFEESNVALGRPGPLGHAVQSLNAFEAVAGLTYDVWRLRARAGIAACDVVVHGWVLGQTVRASELDLGYAVSIGALVVNRDRFSLGLEARMLVIVDAAVTVFSAGTTMRFDALRF